MKYRFARYWFVRYWFRFLSRPWINTYPSKHFVYLQDVFKTCLEHVFSVTIFGLPRRLQDVLKTSCKYVLKTSSRRLEDILQDILKTPSRRFQHLFARRLQEVLEDEKLLRWRRVEDDLKTCLEDVFNTCLEDVFKTNKCLLGVLSQGESPSIYTMMFGWWGSLGSVCWVGQLCGTIPDDKALLMIKVNGCEILLAASLSKFDGSSSIPCAFLRVEVFSNIYRFLTVWPNEMNIFVFLVSVSSSVCSIQSPL